MIIVKHIFQWLSFFVYPWGLGVIWVCPWLICGENPQGTSTPVWLYTEYFLCFWHDSFVLLPAGSYESCRYFTAGKIMERWTLLTLTTGHVVFCEMFASVDKLEDVPILCVEQLVLPLFWMNASQSVIITLWRSGPVWLCPFWDMTVFIRQDYLQCVMLWCDKNKVNGFFVFLFCCSFESYTLLWLVQQVGALPLVID